MRMPPSEFGLRDERNERPPPSSPSMSRLLHHCVHFTAKEVGYNLTSTDVWLCIVYNTLQPNLLIQPALSVMNHPILATPIHSRSVDDHVSKSYKR